MGLADAAGSRDDVPVDLSNDTVNIRPLGYKAWRALLEAHPADDRRLRFDRDTFVPDALEKCVVEADDADDVERFMLDAHPGDVEHLVQEILTVHDEQPEGPTRPRG